jgi:integrase
MSTTITQAHATKANTPSRIYDTHPGLHLWVKSQKAKYWIYRTAKGGKRTDLSLGKFPDVGVAEARKKASTLALEVQSLGHAPKRVKTTPEAVLPKAEVVFQDFAQALVQDMSPQWRNTKHASQWANTLRDYAYPIIGQKPIGQINTEDILQILKPIWQTKTETATRLRGRVEKVLAAATIKGHRTGVNPAQWRGHLDCLLPQPKKLQKVKHHPALPFDELPHFIEQLQARRSISALALEFCILTTSRTSEVLLAKWSEVGEAVWKIPADRMKAGKEHIVPLPNRANQILKLAKEHNPNSEYIFSNGQRPLSNMALLTLLKRMGFGHITTHGFRSTFRDWVSEVTDFSPEVAEMCLAHTIGNKVEAAYRRGNLLDKRRTLLHAWARFVLSIEMEKVTTLRAA